MLQGTPSAASWGTKSQKDSGSAFLGTHSPFFWLSYYFLELPGGIEDIRHFIHPCKFVYFVCRESDACRGKWHIYIYLYLHTAQNIHCYWLTSMNTMRYLTPRQGSSTKWTCNPWGEKKSFWNAVNMSCERLEVHCSAQNAVSFKAPPLFDQCCPVKKITFSLEDKAVCN